MLKILTLFELGILAIDGHNITDFSMDLNLTSSWHRKSRCFDAFQMTKPVKFHGLLLVFILDEFVLFFYFSNADINLVPLHFMPGLLRPLLGSVAISILQLRVQSGVLCHLFFKFRALRFYFLVKLD